MIDGVGEGGELRARVRPAAVAGAANEALIKLVARELGVAPSAVAIAAGHRARVKRLSVSGVTPERVMARWPGIGVGG